jgi:cytochrome P450
LQILNILHLGGSDTTASLLTWICYVFSLHPTVTDTVRKEFEEVVLGGEQYDHNNLQQLTLDDFYRVKYTMACIKETLRLFSPGTLLNFEVQDGHELITLSNGLTIDVGVTIFANLEGILKNPTVFLNPEE